MAGDVTSINGMKHRVQVDTRDVSHDSTAEAVASVKGILEQCIRGIKRENNLIHAHKRVIS